MAGAQARFADAVEKSWIVQPRIPLVSSVSGREVNDPTDIRANLVAQLTSPVDYVGLVEQLSRVGATVFVEVGPQQVLTRPGLDGFWAMMPSARKPPIIAASQRASSNCAESWHNWKLPA